MRKRLFGALVSLHPQETNILESEQEKEIRDAIGERMNMGKQSSDVSSIVPLASCTRAHRQSPIAGPLENNIGPPPDRLRRGRGTFFPLSANRM